MSLRTFGKAALGDGTRLPGPSIVVAVLVLVVFGQAVGFDFVWDDHHFLTGNQAVQSLANIPSFFLHDTDSLYRPLRTTLYAIAYALFGLTPAPYHLMGLGLHVTACLLLLRLLGLCGVARRDALLCTLLFAVHPVHIQKFVFITSAFDMPGDLCVLAALCVYLRRCRSAPRTAMAGSALWFAVGLPFAENAAVYPILWALFEFLGFGLPQGERRKRLAYGVGLAAILLGYLAVRTAVLGRLSRPAPDTGFWTTQSVMMVVYVVYWRLMAIPYGLSPIPLISRAATPPLVLGGLAAAGNAAVAGIAFCVRKSAPLVTLGIFWFYVALLPNSNLVPTGSLMAERYLYLPSAGLVFLAAHALAKHRRLARPVCLGLLAFWSLLSVTESRAWKDEVALWTHAISVAPGSETAWGSLAIRYDELGRRPEALAVYREMIRRGMRSPTARQQLAWAAIDAGDYALAEQYLQTLSPAERETEVVAENWVVVRCQLDRPGWPAEAAETLRKYPSAFLYEQVGNCFAKLGQAGPALAHFGRALELQPDNAAVRAKIQAVGRLPGDAKDRPVEGGARAPKPENGAAAEEPSP